VELPVLCPVCSLPLRDAIGRGPICSDCRTALVQWSGPRCPACGHPADLSGERCDQCAESPLAAADIPYLYDGAVVELVAAIKRGYNPRLIAFVADIVAASYRRLGVCAPIVPVPASRSGRRRRGYDQTAVIARTLRRRHGIGYIRALRRRRGTEQKLLSKDQRRENLAQAFRLCQRLESSTMVLLDDVVTTGATLRTCATLLQAAGVERCLAVAIARDV